MSRAVLEEIADSNPVRALGREKRQLTPTEDVIRPFSRDELDRFLDEASHPRYHPYSMAWRLMAGAGFGPRSATAPNSPMLIWSRRPSGSRKPRTSTEA